ncbi:MAG: T9SS type A sorting domain-containing protein [Bacteroidetes bacterium]|nr:MAG: T9SS type A sorting domain-containing protein [Bacteroidota bacterium]
MRHITYIITGILIPGFISAQSFSDHFDSYTAGQKLAAQSQGEWTTWSEAPGGNEDADVSDVKAKSLPNSIYFSSTAQNGGPVDLVRNFGVLNTGSFSMNMNLFVEAGKAAYFNLQQNETIGEVWALDVNFNDDGTLVVENNINNLIIAEYGQNSWFNFRIDINFNLNKWEVFINDISLGSFSNVRNQIASIDIYPMDANAPYASGFYMDDFSYTITPYTLPNLNGALNGLSLSGANLAGAKVTPEIVVRNLGKNSIKSFDASINYQGTTLNQSFQATLASGEQATFSFQDQLTLFAGELLIEAALSNVNGAGNDGDSDDDRTSLWVNPIIPAYGKVVVGEEGTGTWCSWCPRGAVYMDLMENRYHSEWAGIAVHNNDPMAVTIYDAGVGGLTSGYPSALVDRVADIDPSVLEGDFLERIVIPPAATLHNEAMWDAVNRKLTVKVTTNFLIDSDKTYKLACVLTEDSVTGTEAGYAQSNAYAGGNNGEMGGYENLPSKVPADMMVYDHVARAIAPSFAGSAVYSTTINAGDTHDESFDFTLPQEWNEQKLHIIAIVFNEDGTINNAGKSTFTEALASANTDLSLTCGNSVELKESVDGNIAPDVMSLTNFSSDCPNGTVIVSQNPPVGAPIFTGVNQIYVTATDECGNQSTCKTVVTLIDDTDASITCGNLTQMTNSSDGNQVPDFTGTVSSSSNCPFGGVKITQSPSAGSILKQGQNEITMTISDSCGNVNTCAQIIEFTDDLSNTVELEFDHLLAIYPNPAQNILEFTSKSYHAISEISIYNVGGQLIQKYTPEQLHGSIDISSLAPGIYTLKFKNKAGVLGTLKFNKL